MASYSVIGFIDSIKYLPNNGGCLVFVSEFKKGYHKSNGEVVESKYLSWKCIFKPGLVNYINKHFNKGMLVEIKGEVLPYAIEHEKVVEGYSVIGQTLNLFSFPRNTLKLENRMIKESQENSSETPDLDEYNKPDF